ncbi:MAG: glycosyltransferase [Gaiellaceae bacterium MAG52_C11]|nr:glycosyltransferase [Candidatus Gaiellasilicea maunaloa]
MAGVDKREPGVLVVTPSLAISGLSPRGTRARRLVPALARAGYEVQVVTLDDGRLGELDAAAKVICSPPGSFWTVPEEKGDKTFRALRAALVAGARVLLPLPDGQVGWALAAYRALRPRPKPPGLAAVYAIGAPFSALALGAALARRWDLPLIADLGDPWPRRGPAEFLLERWTMRRASAMLVPTKRMARAYRRRFRKIAQIVVAPNGADVLRSKRRKGRPLFLHVGVITGLRIDPEPAFRALAKLDREGLLEFVSYGGAWVPLPPEAAHHHRGPIPQPDARRLMAEASALLILGNRSDIGLPSKTFEVARSDVWALFVSELDWELGAEVIEETGSGEVVRMNAEPAIRAAALAILARERSGERPQPTARYSWEETLATAVDVVGEISRSHRPS